MRTKISTPTAARFAPWTRAATAALLVSIGAFGTPQAAFAQLSLEDFLRSRSPLPSVDDFIGSSTPVGVPVGLDINAAVPMSFTPNDPYFNTGNPVGFPGQWHLAKQSSGALHDVNIAGAWNRGLTGQGVTIGIVDVGIEHTHPDLNPNYVAADSFDFANNDPDPSPAPGLQGSHGTAVAGVAAARGGNNIGGTGAAPNAGLAGLRIGFNTAARTAATLYHSSGENTNIHVKNHSYGVLVPYVSEDAEVNALLTSHNAGTINVFAAGNARLCHNPLGGGCYFDSNNNNSFDPDIDSAISADANLQHMQNIQETVAVGALGSNATFTSYSNWGANMWVTAPSGDNNQLNIMTTDRTGPDQATGGYNYAADGSEGDAFPDLDYTSIFNGTSASAPLVSGIVALGKEAQPSLDTRFTKHLLARTSVVVDPLDNNYTGVWLTNGAGHEFNPNYGFGLIDADAFTREAARFSGVTPLVTETIGLQTVNRAIPDNDFFGIFETFTLTGQDPLEEVEIHLDINHTWRGEVEAFLVSPSGMFSQLMYFNGVDSFDMIDWTFVTNAFWGETPAGEWTLIVRDFSTPDPFTGTWLGYSVLAKMGRLVPEPSSFMMAAMGMLAIAASGRRRGSGRRLC